MEDENVSGENIGDTATTAVTSETVRENPPEEATANPWAEIRQGRAEVSVPKVEAQELEADLRLFKD